MIHCSGIGRILKCRISVRRASIGSSRRKCYHELSFPTQSAQKDTRHHQHPYERLQYHRCEEERSGIVDSVDEDHSVVDMIATPWNPADAMTVMGTYPSVASPNSITTNKSVVCNDGSRRLVAGHEGWGRRRCDGAFVVPGRSGLGTLRSAVPTSSSSSSKDWIPLRRGQELYDTCGPMAPAALFQTAGTAARMLDSIQPGDCVVQNAGNSAVGLMVSQWAASRCSARPVSIIRRSQRTEEQLADLVAFLREFGRNEHVVIEEEMQEKGGDLQQILRECNIPSPTLGINAVGGSSASILMKALADGGTLITYGGMSQKPVPASTYHLIFRSIRCEGYWHSRWMAQESTQIDRESLMNDIVDTALAQTEGGIGIQCPPHQVFPLVDYREALQSDQSLQTVRRKIVFDCQEMPR